MASLKERFEEAAAAKDTEALQAIFKENSNIQTLAKETQQTPTQLLVYAVLADDAQSVNRCLLDGATITPEVEETAHMNDAGLQVYQLLVPAGLDVNRDFSWTGTALTSAIEAHDEAFVKYLLEAGANPNIGMVGSMCAMEIAISEGLPVSVVQLLVKHGNEFPYSGLIVLASNSKNAGVIPFLADGGVDVNETTDKSGSIPDSEEKLTALHVAARNGAAKVVEALLEHGADRRLKDAKGRTALDLAEEASHEEIAKLLKG